MKSGPVIWVEGLIGSGKSTLAEALSKELHLRMFHEPVSGNPYLDKFYIDQKRYALEMQMFLLKRRHVIQKLATLEAEYGEEYHGSVLDRGLPGDRVFAKLHHRIGNIEDLGWRAYEEAFNYACIDLRPPSLFLFLDVEPSVALERIRKRKRPAEAGIDMRYMVDLQRGYLDLLCEIDSKTHAWSKGMEILRLPWNVDHQSPKELVSLLRDRFHIPITPPVYSR
jgi:deoxyadenosine/deoxycytidine kinase